jgi:hypothetical protein
MSNERRYQDHETRQILELAIGEDDGQPQPLPAGDGLTLRELQETGQELGLSPDRITHAVAAFEGRGELVPRRTMLGLPTSVGRVVQLPRNPSQREWELLVAELRTTFDTKGEVTAQGGLREWSDGTLHAFIEPTESGHRLRLVDSSVAAVAGPVLGGALLSFALIVFLALLTKVDPGLKLAFPALLALLGGGLAGGSLLSLPKWAREQEKRMEHISRHAASLLALPAAKDD